MKHSLLPTTFAATTALLVAATALSGCASATPPDSPSGKSDVKIVMVQAGSTIPYQQEEAAGAKAGAAAAGVSISLVGPPLPDVTQQINILQQVVSTRPDGILIQELPPAPFTRPVKLAEEAGITVLPYQIPPAPDSTSTSFVGNNDVDLGRAAGKAVADAITTAHGADVAGEVLTGNCVPGLSVLENRVVGFTEAIKSALTNVEVKAPITTALESGGAYNIWKPAINASPDILSAYSPCEPDTLALTKIRQETDSTWFLVGHDIDKITLAGVASGQILGLYPISAYQHGYLAAHILGTSLKTGQPVPQGWIPEDTVVIDSTNIDTIGAELANSETVGKFWQPYIDKILSKPDYGVRPLREASE